MLNKKRAAIAILSVLSVATEVSGAGLQNEFGMELSSINAVKPMFSFEDNSKIRGGYSTLQRRENDVCISTDTTGLPEGAYTNWWIIFNNPEFCENPGVVGGMCGMADLDNLDVNATVMWNTSGIVGSTGRSTFSACLDEFELSHEVLVGVDGLVDAKSAEIHMVVRYHGPGEYLEPIILGEQLSSYMGGCIDSDSGSEGYPCTDLQYTVHAGRHIVD